VGFFFLHYFASRLGGRPGLSRDYDVSILVCPGLCQVVSNLIEVFEQIKTLDLQFLRLHFERARVSARQPLGNRSHGTLQLFAAIQVAFKDADT
jgi:hypothetical protein